MMRHVIEIAGPVILLIGVVLSVVGTYLMTRMYHTLSPLSFVWAVARVCRQILMLDFSTLMSEAKTAAGTGVVDPERRALSLIGIYLLFVGFIIQVIGTALALMDAWMGLQEKPAACAAWLILSLRP